MPVIQTTSPKGKQHDLREVPLGILYISTTNGRLNLAEYTSGVKRPNCKTYNGMLKKQQHYFNCLCLQENPHILGDWGSQDRCQEILNFACQLSIRLNFILYHLKLQFADYANKKLNTLMHERVPVVTCSCSETGLTFYCVFKKGIDLFRYST